MNMLMRKYPELWIDVHKDITTHDIKTCAAIERRLERQKKEGILLVRQAMKALLKRKAKREWTGIQWDIKRCKRVGTWVVKYRWMSPCQKHMCAYWIKPDKMDTFLVDNYLNEHPYNRRRYAGERDVSGTPEAYIEVGRQRMHIQVEDEEYTEPVSPSTRRQTSL